MCSLSKWLESNKLSLHLGKTESILYGSKRKLKKVDKMKLSCNNIEIGAKKSVKYLGAVIDQDLSGTTMASSVINKVNKCLKFLYRKQDFLDFTCRKLLCFAIIQPNFDYACNVWYRNLEKKLKTKLQCAQNKMIRYIQQYDSRSPVKNCDFKKLKCLDIDRRVEYLTLNSMYNIFHATAPSYMCNIEKVNHNHNTRFSSNAFVLPHVRSKGKTSFKYNGAKLWNSLPNHLKSQESKSSFKRKCKSFLMSKMSREEECDFIFY